MPEPTPPLDQLVVAADGLPSYWTWGGRWTPLVSTEDTAGAYSLLEQIIPEQAGPPPHAHLHTDEVFYILDGEVRLQIGDQVTVGGPGQLVRIPRGTVHAFAVKSTQARFLNFYVPGALDLMITMLGESATGPGLPPDGAEEPPSEERVAAFHSRLEEIATQAWVEQPDLLEQFRPPGGRLGVGGPPRD